MAASVQFKGVESVMQAFQNRDVDAWAVWQHKQFMFKGIGDAELQTLLDNLAANATNCIYTIKIYEGITDAKDIKERTECAGSFNFRLNGDGQEITGFDRINYNRQVGINERLKALEDKLNQEVVVEDDPETIGSVVIDVIKNPDKAMKWAEIIKSIFYGQPMQPAGTVRLIQPPQPAAMGNTNTAQPITADEKEDRIIKVLEVLEAEDPDLLLHLEKLADIAVKKKGAFKNLLSMLELL